MGELIHSSDATDHSLLLANLYSRGFRCNLSGNKYLLSTYCGPDPGLGPGDAVMGKHRSHSGGEVRGMNDHIPRQKRSVTEVAWGRSVKLPKGGGLSGRSIGGEGE